MQSAKPLLKCMFHYYLLPLCIKSSDNFADADRRMFDDDSVVFIKMKSDEDSGVGNTVKADEDSGVGNTMKADEDSGVGNTMKADEDSGVGNTVKADKDSGVGNTVKADEDSGVGISWERKQQYLITVEVIVLIVFMSCCT